MPVAFLSLGSNIEPEKNIFNAVKLLSKYVKILNSSSVYLAEPLIFKSQPKYFNCVLKIETDIAPYKLKFSVLRAIEKELGRKRVKNRYVPRTIDIDIILYGELSVSTKKLIIPDQEIQKREFLAIPLFELEPDLLLPNTRKTIKEVANRFKNPKIVVLKDFTITLQHYIKNLIK